MVATFAAACEQRSRMLKRASAYPRPASHIPRTLPFSGAGGAFALVLINLLNHMDRQMLSAVVGPIKPSFFGRLRRRRWTLNAVMICVSSASLQTADALVDCSVRPSWWSCSAQRCSRAWRNGLRWTLIVSP
jgi:hypothetical protein